MKFVPVIPNLAAELALEALAHALEVRSHLGRPPDLRIGDPAAPYLERWHVLRSEAFCVYLHRMLRDDPGDVPHDHPWRSVSLCLEGELLEHVFLDLGAWRPRLIRPGDVVFREATFAHRLTVPTGPALTLFVTGPRVREWGFHCPNGWRAWRNYVAAGNPGQIGAGCD